jgi:hypothetical protein
MPDVEPTKGFWESLFSSDADPKEREMVQAPPPELVLPDKADYEDDRLAYSMAVRKAKFEHKKALEAYKDSPEDYMIEAAPAAETEDHAAVRRRDIESQMKEYEE